MCVVTDRNVTISIVEQMLKGRFVKYDRDGEEHYNIISALHKSMVCLQMGSNAQRGSNVDAALYWLGRMIEGGEKPECVCCAWLILGTSRGDSFVAPQKTWVLQTHRRC